MSAKREAPNELKPTGRRVESFSDGVFAIVITIMVFEIRIPDSLALANDPAAARQLAGILATYGLSFFVIANLWTSHHYLLFTVTNPARSTIWYNNHLLLWVSVIPIATRFLGMHPTSPRAAAAYGLVGAGATAAFMLLRSHAARNTHNELHRAIHHRVLRRTVLFLALYAASIPLAFVNPWLAWACFIAVPPMLVLPVIQASVMRKAVSEQHALDRSCP